MRLRAVDFAGPQPVDDAVDAPGELTAVGGERQAEHLRGAFLGGGVPQEGAVDSPEGSVVTGVGPE